MRKALLSLVLPVVSLATAQVPSRVGAPTDQDLLIPVAKLQDMLRNTPPKDGKPGELSSTLFSASTFNATLIRLNDPDRPHIHPHASEVYIMQEGAATLETGGTMIGPFTNGGVHHQNESNAGPRQPSPSAPLVVGDTGGTTIEGGRTQTVKAGDIVLIPAGIAHRWTQIDKPVVYLDIKFPKAE